MSVSSYQSEEKTRLLQICLLQAFNQFIISFLQAALLPVPPCYVSVRVHYIVDCQSKGFECPDLYKKNLVQDKYSRIRQFRY